MLECKKVMLTTLICIFGLSAALRVYGQEQDPRDISGTYFVFSITPRLSDVVEISSGFIMDMHYFAADEPQYETYTLSFDDDIVLQRYVSCFDYLQQQIYFDFHGMSAVAAKRKLTFIEQVQIVKFFPDLSARVPDNADVVTFISYDPFTLNEGKVIMTVVAIEDGE